MKISYGTAIYNHKPTRSDMIWRSGFLTPKKKPTMCPVREDSVENYVFAYDNGICVKGYMFKKYEDLWKRTFVCDFDNLTEEQYNKVLEIVGSGKLKRIQGRMSSGMKTEWHLNKDIPDWKPSAWKYKVFFPLDEFYGNNGVMCIREEVEKAYIDVVQFFNPWSERNKTEEIAHLWLKANNNSMYYKHGKRKGMLRNNHPAIVIEDSRFKNYILPDPVEVTNPRHQITYSVIPEMKDNHRFLNDEDWEKIFGSNMVGRFPATTKNQFNEIINLPYDFKDSLDIQAAKKAEKIDDVKDPRLERLVRMALTKTPEDDTRHIPTSKSEMAKKSGKNEWEDLVIDAKLAAATNRAIYSDWENEYELEDISRTLCDATRFLVRCQGEYELGTIGKPSKESTTVKVLKELPWYAEHIFGKTFFQSIDEKKLEKVARSVSKALSKACDTFYLWRLEEKCLRLMNEKPELLERWKTARRKLGATADFKTYYAEKNDIENIVGEEARATKFPYTYVRRGLKKEMVEQALNTGLPMSQEMFIGFVIGQLSQEDGLVENEKIAKWYRDYQSRFNKVQRMDLGNPEIYGQMTGYQLKNGKVRKQRQSHYDEIFKGMNKEQIADWIANSDLHRQMKKKLKGKYLRKEASPIFVN